MVLVDDEEYLVVGEVCRGTGLQVKYVEVLDIEEGANR